MNDAAALAIRVSWRVALNATTIEDHLAYWSTVRDQLHGMWLLLNYNRELSREPPNELMGDLAFLRAVAEEMKYQPLTPRWYRHEVR